MQIHSFSFLNLTFSGIENESVGTLRSWQLLSATNWRGGSFKKKNCCRIQSLFRVRPYSLSLSFYLQCVPTLEFRCLCFYTRTRDFTSRVIFRIHRVKMRRKKSWRKAAGARESRDGRRWSVGLHSGNFLALIFLYSSLAVLAFCSQYVRRWQQAGEGGDAYGNVL